MEPASPSTMAVCTHAQTTLGFIKDYKKFGDEVELTGDALDIPQLVAVSDDKIRTVSVSEAAVKAMRENADYLKEKVEKGTSIYGKF